MMKIEEIEFWYEEEVLLYHAHDTVDGDASSSLLRGGT